MFSALCFFEMGFRESIDEDLCSFLNHTGLEESFRMIRE